MKNQFRTPAFIYWLGRVKEPIFRDSSFACIIDVNWLNTLQAEATQPRMSAVDSWGCLSNIVVFERVLLVFNEWLIKLHSLE